jgi:hypothetical protein
VRTATKRIKYLISPSLLDASLKKPGYLLFQLYEQSVNEVKRGDGNRQSQPAVKDVFLRHIVNFTFAKIKNPFEHVWEGGEVSPFQLQKGLNEDSSSAEVASLLRRLINLFIK